MINRKELAIIIITSIILAFTISFISSLETFLYTLLAVLIVVVANVFAKKTAAYSLDSEIKINFWEVQRWGYKPTYKFKKPIPTGIIIPLLISFLSAGYIYWLASLVFDVKARVYRAAKRWGLYTFSEVTEYHTGLIAASGIAINLLLAIVGYFAGFEEFAKINIYYSFFNLIPISNLDGNKIYFGSVVLWSFLAIITIIGVGYALFLI